MATKRQRGDTWHYTIRRAGLLPRPVYLSFSSEREGDEFVRRLEAQLDRGVVPDNLIPEPKRVVGLSDHARRYLADQHVSATDRACLKIVLARLPALELRELTFAWAAEWVTDLKRKANLSPVTIRHHVGALARCLDWIAAHGDLTANPLRLLPRGYATYTPEDARAAKVAKVAEERDRRLSAREEKAIRKVLAGAAKREDRQRPLTLEHAAALALLFDLALESAMRLRETYTLTRDQIDLPRRTIFLDKTKNGSKRPVPLTTVAVGLLRPYLKSLVGDRVFPWWDGATDRKSLERVTSKLSRQWARIFDTAKVSDLHFHDLRHEATSRLFERTTLGELEIMKITGHSDTRSLARYANLRGSKLAGKLW